MKELTDGRTSGWVTSSRPEGSLYHNDDITCLKNVGAVTKQKLDEAGIKTVKDLVFSGLTSSEIKHQLTVASTRSGISTARLHNLHTQAKTSQPGSEPDPVNYLSAANPYEARYGENWESEIKKVKSMTKYCDVRDLVRHIHDSTRDAFKGTRYETSYLFYHDALISMTDKDCLDWMEEEGILKRWIRPVLGCNDEIIVVDANGNEKRSTRYKGRPVGDCTETMPPDNSLFRDVCCSFDLHVTLTSALPCNDPRCFSKATPRLITSAIERLWDPETGVVPFSNRIIQDVGRLAENFALVVEADGAVVAGVCDRNGHRRGTGTGRRYTAPSDDQSALDIDDLNLHADCSEVVLEVHNEEWGKWQQHKNADAEDDDDSN